MTMFGLEFLILGVIIVLVVRAIAKRRSVTGESAAMVVRRLFQYLAMLITLALTGFGVAGILEAIVASDGAITSDTTLIARSVAFLVVGLPAYAGLAWYTRRQLRTDPTEATSLGWTLYLTIATIGSLIGVVVSGSLLLGDALRGTGLATVALIQLVVWGAVWVVHWRISTGVPDPERLQPARLLGSLTGLAVGLTAGSIAVGVTLVQIYDQLTDLTLVDAGWDRIAGPLAAFIVAAMVWSWYWLHASLHDEQTSLWTAYVLLAGVLTGAIMTVAGAATTLFIVFDWFLSDPIDSAASFFQDVPLALGVVLLGAASWVYHRAVLRSGAAERSDVHRAYDYILSGVGVAITAGGVATLLVFGFRVLADVEVTGSDGTTLAAALTLLLVGVPIWWRHWTRVQRELHSDPGEFAPSLSRRIYVPVVVGVTCLTALVSLIFTVYILVQNILDSRSIAVMIDDVAGPLSLVITCGAVAAYHIRVLRQDRSTLAKLAPRLRVREVILVSEDGTALVEAMTDAHLRVQRLHAAASVTLAPSVDVVMDTLGAETHDRVVVLATGEDHYEVVPID
jgi:hypothetical protein